MSSLSQYEEGSDQNQELSEADVSIDFTDDDSSDSEDEVQGILNAAHEAGILGIVNFRLDHHLKMKKHMNVVYSLSRGRSLQDLFHPTIEYH